VLSEKHAKPSVQTLSFGCLISFICSAARMLYIHSCLVYSDHNSSTCCLCLHYGG